jgi:hypothetical protein
MNGPAAALVLHHDDEEVSETIFRGVKKTGAEKVGSSSEEDRRSRRE